MTYEPINYTQDEALAKKRRLRMKQLTLDSDMRNRKRDIEEAESEKKQLLQDQQRIAADITVNKNKVSELKEGLDFMVEEARKTKKQLINLGD